jgi:gluconokinase
MAAKTDGAEKTVLIIIMMGVEGSGKTTLGRILAAALGCAFYDADDFHSARAKRMMAAGQPLTDADRRPWLGALRGLIEDNLRAGRRMVLACSALKQSYRDLLAVDARRVKFVFLRGSIELIRRRLRERSGHFAGEALLPSQFETLEEPRDAVIVDVAPPPAQVVAAIRTGLGL